MVVPMRLANSTWPGVLTGLAPRSGLPTSGRVVRRFAFIEAKHTNVRKPGAGSRQPL